jgi:hypothetical protein
VWAIEIKSENRETVTTEDHQEAALTLENNSFVMTHKHGIRNNLNVNDACIDAGLKTRYQNNTHFFLTVCEAYTRKLTKLRFLICII